nr:MAG TPA: hypothetical protein [Caudoviricetes sp.]
MKEKAGSRPLPALPSHFVPGMTHRLVDTCRVHAAPRLDGQSGPGRMVA